MNYSDLSLSLAQALVRSYAESKAPGTGATPPRPPLSITISREAGARGSSVAREVAARLNWRAYDQEVLDKVAAEMQQPAFQLEALDERASSWLEDCLSALVNRYHVSSGRYFTYLLATVRGLGELGRSVIVGRGASFILPPETTLRVRLIAALEDRAREVARLRGLSLRDATAWAQTTERQRLDFVRQHFAQDAADPHHYDLVLNMSRLALDEAADVIVQSLRRFEARGPHAGPREGLSPASPGL
jgi:cytidylate kinase